MQRLEVSGAVRPLHESFGVKALTKFYSQRHFLSTKLDGVTNFIVTAVRQMYDLGNVALL